MRKPWGFQKGLTNTSLYCHKRWPEALSLDIGVKELCYLCSKNKGADQLCGNHAADLCYVFAYAKRSCSHVVSQINLQQLFQRCSPANPSTAVFSQKYVFQRSIFVMGIHSVHSKMTRSSAISGHFWILLVSNFHAEIMARMKTI